MQSTEDLTVVYLGVDRLPAPNDCANRHYADAWYFAPANWTNPCPFSPPFESSEQAFAAAEAFEDRRAW